MIINSIFKRLLYTKRSYEEIKIPVPWGHLAAKWWGPRKSQPIIAQHGWLDNSGTFDRLIPHLPPHIEILAIDHPGHGLSSYLPNGQYYHSIDVVLMYKRVIDYFKWSKVSFMSHSIGAMYSFMYTVYYPETVDLLICLDGLFYLKAVHTDIDNMGRVIDKFLLYDHLLCTESEPPQYTYPQLEKILHIASRESINLDCVKYILRRKLINADTNSGMYQLRGDLRVKVPYVQMWSQEMLYEFTKRIKCPLFFSCGKSSYLRKSDKFYVFQDLLDIIRRSNNNRVHEHHIEGTHHLHLNTPENLAPSLNDFLTKYYEDNKGHESDQI